MKREIIDPAYLTRLSGLNLRPRGFVEGGLVGQHRSPHQGASVEFAQHREYSPGDEIRRLDWKAYAKSDRHYIKTFEDETNLRAYLLLDGSNSMDYGAPRTKDLYAARFAAGLAWLLLKQGDAVGLLTFGAALGQYLPPQARMDHFGRLLRAMEAPPVGGQTDLLGALRRVGELASKRSLIVLISDCMDFREGLAAACRQLRQRGHQVVVFQILDEAEWAFPFREITRFEDLEIGAQQVVDPRAMRAQYLKEIRAFCDGLRRALRGGGVGYHRLLTTTPPERALSAYLHGAPLDEEEARA
ncbi:DUF58 domain-containing protein [Myxococcota bacterium]|nr:DUF58 domain-containing protein [Myxococcota bacterium]MBU1430996.1 DUF58 domain-containing protein [Myxococcota bacterium]MBU1900527.1 DUF58 domain-containing protein [Myxococcota bacterium]